MFIRPGRCTVAERPLRLRSTVTLPLLYIDLGILDTCFAFSVDWRGFFSLSPRHDVGRRESFDIQLLLSISLSLLPWFCLLHHLTAVLSHPSFSWCLQIGKALHILMYWKRNEYKPSSCSRIVWRCETSPRTFVLPRVCRSSQTRGTRLLETDPRFYGVL